MIAEHRSLRRAAAAVGISESALSHRLRSLEDALTVALFHRSSEGVEPTNAGAAFFERAREALRMLDLATANAAATSRGVSGRLTLGLYTSLSSGRLRNSLAEFAVEHPEIDIQIIEGGRPQMIEGLRSRAIDVSVLVGSPDLHIGDALPLWRERIHVIVKRDHRLASAAQVAWSDLYEESFLFSTRDSGPEAEFALVSKLGGPGQWLSRRVHAVSRETIYALVGLGQGIALMIDSDLGHHMSDVVSIPLHDSDGPTTASLIAYRDAGNDNPPLRRYWSLLKSRYSECV